MSAKPIYDVADRRSYGTGFDLSLEGALAHAEATGGTVMVSRDGGQSFVPYVPEAG